MRRRVPLVHSKANSCPMAFRGEEMGEGCGLDVRFMAAFS